MLKKQTGRIRRRDKKNISTGTVHINATFNNTKIVFSDEQGNTISWSSAGSVGFKGSKKSTPYAAQVAMEKAAEDAQVHGLKYVSARVKGPGSGRETALRALQTKGFIVGKIEDVTPIPHNGCRPPKRRRV